MGIASAAETVQEDNTCTTEKTVVSDTSTISQVNKETIDNEKNILVENPTEIDENKTHTINKKTNTNLKKDSTVEVHNYTQLAQTIEDTLISKPLFFNVHSLPKL